MLNKFFVLFVFLLVNILPSIADVDIIHPKQKNITINSSETYFMGNVQDGECVFINSKLVTLYQNRFFVEMVPLNVGLNKIVVVSDVHMSNKFKYALKDFAEKNNKVLMFVEI